MDGVVYATHLLGAYLLGARDVHMHLEGGEDGESGQGSATLERSWERFAMRVLRVPHSFPSAVDEVISKDIRVAAWGGGTNRARLYVPCAGSGGGATLPIVVYIHGGGFTASALL